MRRSLFGSEEDKPGTENPRWSLDQCRVPQAWARIRTDGRRPGEGVRIGHPDSGFLPHTEMDSGRVLGALDWDFIDDDESARTQKAKHGSHGLATASVIMSGTGDASDRISGPALHAEILPMRVTKPGLVRPTPVLLHGGMRRLRDAVDYARRHDCHVISMSLGGPGHRGLHKAIRRATDAGVIVLAAAGNQVSFVVWPARYAETIAVAASNIERKPWKGSCRGKAVDVTAPGESVWRATFSDSGETVGRSYGTSYAVATVAGIAALWRSYHADALATFPPAQIPEILRRLLKRSATSNAHLPRNEFGAGIVDALALIETPLPKRAAVKAFNPAVRGAMLGQEVTKRLGVRRAKLDEGAVRELLSAEALGVIVAGDLSKRKSTRRSRGSSLTGLSPRVRARLLLTTP